MIGEMNEKAVLLSNTASRDDEGGLVDSWTSYATVWVNVRWTGTKTQSFCGMDRTYSTYVLKAWRDSRIAIGHRINVAGLTLSVEAIDLQNSTASISIFHCVQVQS